MKRIFFIILILFMPLFVHSGAIVAYTDWNDGTLGNWTENQSWVSIVNPGSGGITNSGYLQITLNETDPLNEGLGEEWWALTRIDITNFYSAAWSTNFYIQFNFMAKDVPPEYIQVRWSGDPARVWRDTVFDLLNQSMTTQTWYTFQSDTFANWASWDYGGGTDCLLYTSPSPRDS